MTDAPDQDDELYNPESEHDINEKKGTFIILVHIVRSFYRRSRSENIYSFESLNFTNVSGSKRKNERGDSQDTKRLRSSGHTTRQTVKRAGHSAGSNGKKTSNPRGRHAPDDLYEDRKSHGGRGSAPQSDLSKGYGDKGMSRSRDSQRRIKPLMRDLTEVCNRFTTYHRE